MVKLFGDGAMLHFESVDEGLAGVLELVARLGEVGMLAHGGIHAVPIIEHDQDYFGGTLNLASRVTAVAGPGEVVVTEGLVAAVEGDGYVFEPLPRIDLEGSVIRSPCTGQHRNQPERWALDGVGRGAPYSLTVSP